MSKRDATGNAHDDPSGLSAQGAVLSVGSQGRLFGALGLSYVVCFPYQSVNAVIAPSLSASFGLGQGAIGLLTSIYLLAFAAAQVPLGLALDRYGPRRTHGALLCLASLGALVFATAQGFAALLVGRALIGIGVSGCLMAAFRSFAIWMPPAKLPFANAVQLAIGGIGAMAATSPLQRGLEYADWRTIFLLLSGLTLMGAVLVFIWVPEQPGGGRRERLGQLLAGLHTVWTSRRFWVLAPWCIAGQAAFIALFSLWSGEWLREVAGLGAGPASDALFAMAAAMTVGYLLSGRLVAALQPRGFEPAAIAAVGMAAFIGVQSLIAGGWTGSPGLLWVAFALSGGFCILPYAILPTYFPANLGGRVITALNLLVFAVAFAEQWAIGAIVERWPRGAAGSSQTAFGVAFAAVILPQALAGLWFLRRRHHLRSVVGANCL